MVIWIILGLLGFLLIMWVIHKDGGFSKGIKDIDTLTFTAILVTSLFFGPISLLLATSSINSPFSKANIIKKKNKPLT